MANPEFGSFDGFGRMRCPCGSWMLLTCDRAGKFDFYGALRLCWACQRIITTDAVVIGRVPEEVK